MLLSMGPQLRALIARAEADGDPAFYPEIWKEFKARQANAAEEDKAGKASADTEAQDAKVEGEDVDMAEGGVEMEDDEAGEVETQDAGVGWHSALTLTFRKH
jgi:hypothetical protein